MARLNPPGRGHRAELAASPDVPSACASWTRGRLDADAAGASASLRMSSVMKRSLSACATRARARRAGG